MAKKKKTVRRVLVVILVVVTAAVIGLKVYLNKAIAAAATSVAGVETKVEKASLSIFSGRVVIEGLEMKNPEGYRTPYFCTLKKCVVKAQPRSFLSDEIVVDEIFIDSMDMYVESRDFKYNFEVILDNLEKGKKRDTKDAGRPKRFRVNRIEIKDTTVRVHVIGETVIQVKPGDITMHDLSSTDNKPLLLADVFQQVMTTVCVEAASMPGGLLPGRCA